MTIKSEDKLGKIREEKTVKKHEKIGKKFEHILSELNEKERVLKKSIADLEEKLVNIRFEETIRAKQRAIDQLALKKTELEARLKELEKT